jgi:hypothetical protein
MFESPKSYNEMLSQLNFWTALLTFAYSVVLVAFGIVPKIPVINALVPPIKGYTELLNWALSFGVVPTVCAVVALILSRALEMHNSLSKLIQLRFAWDKYFIVKPLRARAQSDVSLDRKTVRKVMNEFYYGAVKDIDQHYVQLFWRYALPFWIIFEHLLVVAVSIAILTFLRAPHTLDLFFYLIGVAVLGAVQFFAVTARKSLDQVRQIPTDKISDFFSRLRLVARA